MILLVIFDRKNFVSDRCEKFMLPASVIPDTIQCFHILILILEDLITP